MSMATASATSSSARAYGDDGGIDAGEAYVIFGKAAGSPTIDLSTSCRPTDSSSRATPRRPGGLSVSSAGDINGDGFDDLIVGAR